MPNTTIESPVDYCEGFYRTISGGGAPIDGWMHVTSEGCMLIVGRFLLRPDHTVRQTFGGVTEGTWEGDRFYFSITVPYAEGREPTVFMFERQRENLDE